MRLSLKMGINQADIPKRKNYKKPQGFPFDQTAEPFQRLLLLLH